MPSCNRIALRQAGNPSLTTTSCGPSVRHQPAAATAIASVQDDVIATTIS